jgi:hypothetical protein
MTIYICSTFENWYGSDLTILVRTNKVFLGLFSSCVASFLNGVMLIVGPARASRSNGRKILAAQG